MTLFLESVLFGIPLGILYDIFRNIRIIIPHSTLAVAAEDLLFFVFYSVFIMCFTYAAARSEFRMYFVFGNLAGFSAYYFTAGKQTVHIMSLISLHIRKIFKKLK